MQSKRLCIIEKLVFDTREIVFLDPMKVPPRRETWSVRPNYTPSTDSLFLPINVLVSAMSIVLRSALLAFRNPLRSLHKLTLLFHDCNQSAAS